MAGFTDKMLTAALVAGSMLGGCDTADSETVGPRGGVVFSDDGRVTLEVPEGALGSEVEISIHRIDNGPENAIGPTYEILPRGTTFSQPATLVYDVAAGEEMDVPMESVTVVTEGNGGWNKLADIDADLEEQVIYASVLYLSRYAPVLD
jgi:hypothetical protein